MSKDDYLSYVVDQGVQYAAPIVKDWAAKRYRGAVQGGLDLLDTKINSFVDNFWNYDPKTRQYKDYRNFGASYSPNMSKRSSRSFESQGYSPAPEFSHWSQGSNASRATSASTTVNGQSTPSTLSDGVTCPAMFNPGRGAELGLVNKLIDAPLHFKTGEHPGPSRPVDAFATQLQLYRGMRLNHSFAFKCLVPTQVSTTGLLINRGYVHNVFRHYNYQAYGTGATALDLFGPTKARWNNTLGPDGGDARLAPLCSNPGAVTLNGLSAALKTPYRNPAVGAIMYSRMTQQFMENVGWSCHPFKYVQPLAGSGTGTDLTITQPNVYGNAGTNHVNYPRSMPAQQPATPGTVLSTITTSSPYYYKTQIGKGKVSYDFSNDGTCPVVIDVVITKVKQGMVWNCNPLDDVNVGNKDMLDNVYKNGYLRMATANASIVGTDGLNGQAVDGSDCLTNARCQFMPKSALKYAQNQPVNSSDVNGPHEMPFKQVARDQFIISAGASRAWSMDLPSLDYDARRYGNVTTATAGASFSVVQSICCDFTYIVSIGYSSVSTPVFETPTGVTQKPAIIDRRPGDCNVSVTGAYEEYVHPVYLGKETLTNAYINGALDVPYYTTAPTGTISNQEIANLNQVTRGSTGNSALISVGAVNTIIGA